MEEMNKDFKKKKDDLEKYIKTLETEKEQLNQKLNEVGGKVKSMKNKKLSED